MCVQMAFSEILEIWNVLKVIEELNNKLSLSEVYMYSSEIIVLLPPLTLY